MDLTKVAHTTNTCQMIYSRQLNRSKLKVLVSFGLSYAVFRCLLGSSRLLLRCGRREV